MEDFDFTFTRSELEIILHALSSTQPANKETEEIHFKLYYKLKFKLTAKK